MKNKCYDCTDFNPRLCFGYRLEDCPHNWHNRHPVLFVALMFLIIGVVGFALMIALGVL